MPYQSDLYIEASHVDYKEQLEETPQLAEIRVGICQYRGRTPDFWCKE